MNQKYAYLFLFTICEIRMKYILVIISFLIIKWNERDDKVICLFLGRKDLQIELAEIGRILLSSQQLLRSEPAWSEQGSQTVKWPAMACSQLSWYMGGL